MINFLKTWSITTGVFLAGDILWLYCVLNRFFVPQIKHLMKISDTGIMINYFSASIAYFLISGALTVFVVMPFFQESFMKLFLHGALLGLCIYGVYEFTNYATLLNWPLSFLIVDIAWGAVWCGMATVISVALLRFICYDNIMSI